MRAPKQRSSNRRHPKHLRGLQRKNHPAQLHSPRRNNSPIEYFRAARLAAMSRQGILTSRKPEDQDGKTRSASPSVAGFAELETDAIKLATHSIRIVQTAQLGLGPPPSTHS
jgi:hypothetical protein